MTEFIERAANKNSLIQRKLLYGIGINDADYIIKNKIDGKIIYCPYYLTWSGMLSRCYYSYYQKKHPTYLGCTVCSDWLVFSKFKKWMTKQDFKDKQLDKDILLPNNKIYGPSYCLFIPHRVNSLLNDRSASRGIYSIGVCFNKNAKRFQANCNNGIKKVHLGLFNTEQEAHQAYLKYKKQVIIETALEQDDIRLKDALLRIADTYEIENE